jgi:hypothetical protein
VNPFFAVGGLLTAVALLFAAGCGGGGGVSAATYPVSGKVLLPDGKPLPGGTIYFYPKESGSSASAEVSSAGEFSLKTADGRDGAPAGEYKVRVVPGTQYISKKTNRVDPTKLPFASKYMDEDGDTGLTATVKAEPNTLPPFKLEAAKAEPSRRERD